MLQLPRKTVAAWGYLAAAVLAVLALPALALPQRVVSSNLCTDQLVLALADRSQILSLSPLARDPTISFLATDAAELPMNGGRGETIVFSGADLVFAGPDSHLRRGLLEGQGLPVVVLDTWRDLAHGSERIRNVASRLGHPERGERLLA